MIFLNFFLQMFFLVGLVAVVAFVIWGLNRAFYKMTSDKSKTICVVTGFIGTPVHELGHAFFCLVFGHKIQAISLYKINHEDGVLGYVQHAYNKKNLYQKIGNFFVGFGPIIFGTFALVLLMLIFVPHLLFNFWGNINPTWNNPLAILRTHWNIFVTLFALTNLGNFWWWVFLVFALSIALHMSLSPADIKGCFTSFMAFAVLVFVLDFILIIIGESVLWGFTTGCMALGMIMLCFMSISLLISVMLVAVTRIVKICTRPRRYT